MRLIRLTTTDTQAFFDNSFNEDITINENSQICLENLVAELPPKAIIIDGSNDTISYQLQDTTSVGNGGIHSIQLTHGQYGGNSTELDFTFEELLIQITKKLNDSLTALTDRSGGGEGTTTKEIGGMFNVSLNSKKFVELEYTSAGNNPIAGNTVEDLGWTLTNTAITNTPNGFGGRSGGTLNTFDSYMYNSTELSEGAGRISFRIRDLEDGVPAPASNDNHGMIVAVSKVDPQTWATGTIDYTKIYAGIQISARTVPYGFVDETGVDFTTTALTPNILQTAGPPAVGYGSNPIVSIGVSIDGGLFGQVLQDDGAGNQEETTLFDFENEINPDKFYPIIIFLGGGSTGSTAASGRVRTQLMRYYPNPYPVAPKTDPHHWLTTISTEQFSIAPATFKLIFPDITVASFLGFTEKEYSFSWTTTINFAGTLAPQTNTSYADSYIVEMLGGIELNSYDGYTKSRKDILATIPNNQDVNNILRYSSSTPYFLNIRNKQKSIIRNIRCRILNLDYSPVVLQGQATMTLLIKDKDDLTRYGM